MAARYKQDKRVTKLPDVHRRLVPSPKPGPNAPEYLKAAWWRVHVMRMSQGKLASLLNVRRATIWRFENGEQPITRLFRLACLGLQTMRPWDPAEWPHFGDEQSENLTFKRMQEAELEPPEVD